MHWLSYLRFRYFSTMYCHIQYIYILLTYTPFPCDRHDITEILMKVSLNTITPLPQTDPIPMSTTANYWSRYIIIQYTSYLHISYEMEPVILNQWCPLRFPHKTMHLPPVVWRTANVVFMLFVFVCLRIVMSRTYVVVFLFCLSSSCVSNITSFSAFSIFNCPFDIL